jgi:hypothetical protein
VGIVGNAVGIGREGVTSSIEVRGIIGVDGCAGGRAGDQRWPTD